MVLKNLKIEEKQYIELKKYCNKMGLKMYSFVTKTIQDVLNREKENDNLQNNKSH